MSNRFLHSRKSSPRAFTLIEILVVIAIIVILAAILLAVGSQVIAKAKVNQTRAALKTLEGLMKEYIQAGNPEPGAVAASTINDPNDENDWVIALRSSPEYAKKLSSLKSIMDASNTHVQIVDGFGQPIRYIPFNSLYGGTYNALTTKKDGYFQSAGPDRQINTADDVFSNEP